jgi:hypothetical protein
MKSFARGVAERPKNSVAATMPIAIRENNVIFASWVYCSFQLKGRAEFAASFA